MSPFIHVQYLNVVIYKAIEFRASISNYIQIHVNVIIYPCHKLNSILAQLISVRERGPW